MALLGIGMAAVVTTFSALLASSAHQRHVTQALHIAEGTVEELLVRYAEDAELTNGGHVGPTFTSTGLAGGTFFQTSWQVEVGVPLPQARQVRVTVTWTERTGVRKLSLVVVRT